MAQGQHTPGPWSIRKESSVSAEFVESGDDQIAMLCDGDDKTRMANARLIAAAPDMLSALKVALTWSDADWVGHEIVTAAVAKAAASTRRDGPVLREGV